MNFVLGPKIFRRLLTRYVSVRATSPLGSRITGRHCTPLAYKFWLGPVQKTKEFNARWFLRWKDITNRAAALREGRWRDNCRPANRRQMRKDPSFAIGTAEAPQGRRRLEFGPTKRT